MTYVGKVLAGNRVTIPEKWVKLLKMKAGDVVILELKSAPFGVLIRPAEVMPKEG